MCIYNEIKIHNVQIIYLMSQKCVTSTLSCPWPREGVRGFQREFPNFRGSFPVSEGVSQFQRDPQQQLSVLQT